MNEMPERFDFTELNRAMANFRSWLRHHNRFTRSPQSRSRVTFRTETSQAKNWSDSKIGFRLGGQDLPRVWTAFLGRRQSRLPVPSRRRWAFYFIWWRHRLGSRYHRLWWCHESAQHAGGVDFRSCCQVGFQHGRISHPTIGSMLNWTSCGSMKI